MPSATESLYALGLGERVVGVTHECDFPPEARAKPHLTRSTLPGGLDAAGVDRHVRESLHAGSSLYALDAPRLEQLAPDLIVTQELCAVCAVSYDIVARAAKRLRGDPRVVSLEPSSLEDVFANIATLGELTGSASEAARLVASLCTRLAAVDGRAAPSAGRPTVLVLEWTDPPMSGGHWTPELVELAGGTPVLAHPGANSQRLTWDAVASADPDVVFVAPCGYGIAASLAAVRELATEPRWNGLRAVREKRAYAVDGNAYVNRPGPRLIDTIEIFASGIRGRAFGAALADPDALRAIA